jgi:fluoride exporter
MNHVVLIFVGGGIGSVARYLIGIGALRFSTSLPWGTFIANVTACLIYAVTAYIMSVRPMSEGIRLALLTGICGGLSTFSTFGFETFTLLKQGMMTIALLNVVTSTSICLLIFYIFSR